jgi:hypothetical protein
MSLLNRHSSVKCSSAKCLLSKHLSANCPSAKCLPVKRKQTCVWISSAFCLQFSFSTFSLPFPNPVSSLCVCQVPARIVCLLLSKLRINIVITVKSLGKYYFLGKLFYFDFFFLKILHWARFLIESSRNCLLRRNNISEDIWFEKLMEE